MSSFPAIAAVVVFGVLASVAAAADPVQRIRLLPPGENNPRNSEGSFVTLRDGRVLFVYTKFYAGRGRDADPSLLAARESRDGGATWTDRDVTVLENEGKENTMSVSLLRLRDGRIGLFYIVKNSLQDCRPYVRFSSDEARTWSERTLIVPDRATSYYVLNNDRVIQLRSGRLIVPLARHDNPVGGKFDASATLVCYLSDDGGKTWRQSRGRCESETVVFQEPGLVELKDGRVMMFIRTRSQAQFVSYSGDGGETWSEPEPHSGLPSPTSPASIERIPSTGDLLVAWNNHAGVDSKSPIYQKRTPFTVAISKDEGRTWTQVKDLETNPDGWYCYTAIEFVGEHVLLGHCAGERSRGNGLGVTQITRLPLTWLYE